jgi:hypothetical protein
MLLIEVMSFGSSTCGANGMQEVTDGALWVVLVVFWGGGVSGVKLGVESGLSMVMGLVDWLMSVRILPISSCESLRACCV